MAAMPTLVINTSMVETVLCDACLHVSRVRARLVHVTDSGVRTVGQLDRCAVCTPPDEDPNPEATSPASGGGDS